MTDEFDTFDDLEDELDEDDEPVEAYCVVCRHMVEIAEAEPVWTSKGTPGTRGQCSDCGTTVFRMGMTPAHAALTRPPAVRVESSTKIATDGGKKRALPATYINYAGDDAEFARKLAADLENMGIHTWIDSGQHAEEVKWASGVHPALKESAKMVVVLSAAAQTAKPVIDAWTFFKTQKKRIVVALVGPAEVPDELRRSPRFDFSTGYKTAFRELVSALSE